MHPWFRTLDEEVRDRSLSVDGRVPRWLDGVLIRNGPAHFETNEGTVNHWFDGLAMLRRFGFGGGSVNYTNRFLRTAAYRTRLDGGVVATEFGTGPTSLFRRVRSLVRPTVTDNANVTVARLGGRTVALTETPQMVAFDPETLLTFGTRAFEDDVPGQWTMAHIEPDRERGEAIGLTVEFGRRSAYHLYRLSAGSRRREQLARVPVAEPAYIHSVGLTERFVVLPETPFTVDPRRFLSPSVASFVDAFEWDDDRDSRFYVIDRTDGTVATADAPPFFFFHTVNAFEESDEIVVDLVAFADATIVDGLSFDRVADGVREATGDLRRFRLSLADGSVRSRTLATGLALPRTSPAVRRRPYRYAYAQRTGRDEATGVVKVDIESENESVWLEAGCFAGEPVFVPRGTETDRRADDGVVLSVVLDAAREQSFLLVLDGTTFEERARAWLPHALPLGFHGEYFE